MPSRGRDRRGPGGASRRASGEQLPWAVVYYRAPDGTVPALEFLDNCPGKIDAEFTAVLDAVAAAPPPRFSGGGNWEAIHGTMGGWYEIGLTGPGREQFRLFRLLENAAPGELARRGLQRSCGRRSTGAGQLYADHPRRGGQRGREDLRRAHEPRPNRRHPRRLDYVRRGSRRRSAHGRRAAERRAGRATVTPCQIRYPAID
jgi:hypothetical protein